jgi:hypothetical protein
MAASKNKTPDLFKEESFDPMEVATGPRRRSQDSEKSIHSAAPKDMLPETGAEHAVNKKKAGFYISVDLLERFSRKFYELKLAGVAIDNKSALLELALSFALDDLDKGPKSRVLQVICRLS